MFKDTFKLSEKQKVGADSSLIIHTFQLSEKQKVVRDAFKKNKKM